MGESADHEADRTTTVRGVEVGASAVSTWTVLFTDITGSTTLRVQLGEDAFDAVLEEHDRLTYEAIAAHGGSVVKHTGDGVMAAFGGASDALASAARLQRAFDRRNRTADAPLGIRVGLSIGDAVIDGDDIRGFAAVEARRLCDAAEPGEVLCTELVCHAAGTRGGHRFGPVRRRDLKGLREPVPSCALEWADGQRPADGPADVPQLRVFGPLAAQRGEHDVSLGGPKERAVLATLLAADGEPVSIETLSDALWGDAPPRSAARTVHAYIARIRRTLGSGTDGDGALVTQGRTYSLSLPRANVDALRFVDAAARGRALVDRGDPGAAVTAFDDALRESRGAPYEGHEDIERCAVAARALAETRRIVVEDRFDALLALGHASDLVPALEVAVSTDPMRERLWGQLMLALYRSGRQADALRAFRRARQALVDELGIEPGTALRELEAAILTQDDDRLRSGSASDEPVVALPAALDTTGSLLIGRDEELARLRESWHDARSGKGAFVSIVGAEGVGKTRLAAELAGEAHRADAVVCFARCDTEHRSVRALFDQALRSAGSSLMRVRSEGRPGEALGASIARRLSTWATTAPVLVVLDDLHEADGDVLEVVAEVASSSSAAATLVVAIFRTERGEVPPRAGGEQIALGGLHPSGVAEICALYGDAWTTADVERIHAHTEGVPLAVHEEAAAYARDAAARRVDEAASDAKVAGLRLAESQQAVADEVVGIHRVVEQRRRQLATRTPVATASTCPFRGLMRFDTEDAPWFFGRERTVAEIVAHLVTRPVIAVFGASGSGKSSLVRAGLIPALAEGVLPGSESWRVVIGTPGAMPDAELRRLLAEADHEAAADRLVIVVDQLEELFTLCTDPDEREAFARTLDAAMWSGAALVVVVRADQMAGITEVPTLARLLGGNDLLVGPIRERELRDAIVRPAERAGLQLEDGLVEEILADAQGSSGVLPLVQTALLETWVRRSGNVLTLGGYHASGGVHGAIARLADTTFDSFSDSQRDAARRILLRLANASDDGTLDLRRRVPRRDLAAHDDADAWVAFEQMVQQRLLTSDDDTVEIAHEALLREWPRLRAWLEEDVEGRRLQQRLTIAARSWEDSNRDPSELYRGTRLDAVLDWRAAGHAADLNDAERDFVDASETEAARELSEARAQATRERHRSRQLRSLLAGVALLLVVALVAAGLAFVQSDRADRERTGAEERARALAVQELVARVDVLHDTKRDLAALLAAAAYEIDPGADTFGALLGTFTSDPMYERTLRIDDVSVGQSAQGRPSHVTEGVMSADGGEMIVTDDAQAVWEIDLDSGAVRPLLPGVDPPLPGPGLLAVSDDGRYVARLVDPGRFPEDPRGSALSPLGLSVFDVETGVRRFPDVELRYPAGSVAFSPDGELIATGGGAPGTVEVRSAVDGGLVASVPGLPRPTGAVFNVSTAAVTFLPDGTLAIGSQQGPLRIVDPRAGRELIRIDGPQESASGVITASRDGKRLFGMSAGGLAAFDVEQRTLLWSHPADGQCNALAVAEQIGALLCGSEDGHVYAYDLQTGTRVQRDLDYQLGPVRAVAVTPDGSRLVEAGGAVLSMWRLDGGGAISRLIMPGIDAFPQEYDGRGRLLVQRGVPGPDGLPPGIDLIDTATGEIVDPLDGIIGAVAAAHPDRLAALFADGTSGRYDTARRERERLSGPGPGFTPVGAYAIEDRLVAWSDDRIQGVDGDGNRVDPSATTGATTTRHIRHLTVSRDGSRLFTLEGIFELVQRQASGYRTGAEPVRDVVEAATTRDVVVVGTTDLHLRVLDAGTLEPSGAEMPGVSAFTELIRFAHDEKRMLVILADRTVRLGDLPSRSFLGDPIDLGVYTGPNAATQVNSRAAIRGDGNQIAIGTSRGVVIWDLDPETLVEAACSVAGRDITEREWRDNIGSLAPYRSVCAE
jgi:DNA-binding SARP family transcriptional activator/class 3 adenylate cyclase/WD40 repeat protein